MFEWVSEQRPKNPTLRCEVFLVTTSTSDDCPDQEPQATSRNKTRSGSEMVYQWSPRTRRTVALGIGFLAALVLWGSRDIIGPFVWAGIFAYIFNPAVQGLIRVTRLPRAVAVALLFGIGISVVAEILGQPMVVQDVIDSITAGLTGILTDASKAIGAFRSAFTMMLHGLLAVVAAGYLLLAGPSLVHGILRLLPAHQKSEAEILVGSINNVLGGFIRGEAMLIVIMSVTTFIGLSIIGIPFAVILAIATGFLELIPVFGPIIAATPPIIIALFTSNNFGWPGWVAALVVAGMYTVLRQLEDYLIIPNVVGRVVRVHPLVALFAIFAGLQIWGVTGMVIALPVAGVARVLLGYAYRRTVVS